MEQREVKKVGVRDMKDNFCKYFMLVREGTEIIVTRYGRDVAHLVPLRRTLEKISKKPSFLGRKFSSL